LITECTEDPELDFEQSPEQLETHLNNIMSELEDLANPGSLEEFDSPFLGSFLACICLEGSYPPTRFYSKYVWQKIPISTTGQLR